MVVKLTKFAESEAVWEPTPIVMGLPIWRWEIQKSLRLCNSLPFFYRLIPRHGPSDANRFGSEMDEKACVECDVVFAPFSLMDHKRIGQNKRVSIEYALALRRCFEKVILTTIYPRSRIQISCTILQSDGGELPCLLNASLLALVNAGVAIYDFQVSLSVGYMDNTILMDMNRSEAKLNGIVLTVAYLPRFDKFTLVTMDNNIPIELFEVGLLFPCCFHTP